jgi:Glycosyltransferase 61
VPACRNLVISGPELGEVGDTKRYNIDQVELKKLVDDVLSAENPDGRLHDLIVPVAFAQQLDMQAALYESVVAVRPVRQFWVLYTMARCYDEMGRADACYFVACQALELEGQHLHSWSLYRDAFNYLTKRACYQAAIDLFKEQINRWPDSPVAPQWELSNIANRAGLTLGLDMTDPDAPLTPNNASVVRVFEPEIRTRWSCKVYGPHAPVAITALDHDLQRQAIDAVKLDNAELLIYNDKVVIVDCEKQTLPYYSIGEYPAFVRKRAEQILAEGGGEEVTTDIAVVISDHFIVPNLCHFLYDHISRLEVYKRAGVSIANALVVGGVIEAEFQRSVLNLLGIKNYLHTKRIARVRAREVWVSSNCRHLQHPGHLGAAWVVRFLRDNLIKNPSSEQCKIYISRSDARSRRVRNEAEMIAELERHGFRSIIPGNMSFSDQVMTLTGASHVVGPHGAGMTNAIFSRPGTAVLEIFPPLYSTNGYAMMAREAGWRYSALTARDWESDAPELNDPKVADTSTGRFGNRDIWINLDLLRQWLSEHL